MKNTKKLIVAIAALSILLCCAVGGTLAYLRDVSKTVTNTFTYGDINITLAESENLNLKMIPGGTIAKDPIVTVKANSEECYLFVKIDATEKLSDYLSYELADGWIELSSGSGVYYRIVASATTDATFPILKNNQVTVKTTVTKEMMEAVKANAELVKLSFTAYAVQKEGFNTAAAAWAVIPANEK